jgi:hypothetical protein
MYLLLVSKTLLVSGKPIIRCSSEVRPRKKIYVSTLSLKVLYKWKADEYQVDRNM